jgi:hypothetical protein
MPLWPLSIVFPGAGWEQAGVTDQSHAAVGPTLASFHDFPVAQLTAEVRRLLDEAAGDDWFHSFSFAGNYCFPVAERVCFLTDPQGKIIDACFYREERRWGLLREIHVQGRALPGSAVVRHLVETRKPARIHLPWLRRDEIEAMSVLPLRCSARPAAEDFLIALPARPEQYLQTLGSKTRKHLPYYLRRLEREWGDNLAVGPCLGPEVTRELYQEILDLNRQRMQKHHRESAWHPGVVEQRWPLVQERGLLYGVYYRKRLVAGTLSFLHANNAYLIVLAHDPEFDRLNLGSVVLWLTLQHLIRLQLGCFHLMWGASFYKTQLGGKIESLFRVTGFSSPVLAAAGLLSHALGIGPLSALASKGVRRLAWEIGHLGRSR